MVNAPQAHKRLAHSRRRRQLAAASQVAEITLGDSRNAYTRHRQQAGFTRIHDVPIRSVFVAAENSASANMHRDGFGLFLVASGITNITSDVAAPGASLALANNGTGIANTLPVSLYQFMGNGANTASLSRVWVIYTTYAATGTNGMNSTNDASSVGGNARRGLPYAPVTPIAAVEVFRVSDSRASSAWSVFYLEAGQSVNNSDEANIGLSAGLGLPPAAAAGQLLITSEVWNMPAFTLGAGNGVAVRYRFAANPNTGQGGVVAGARVIFRGTGVTYYAIAQGGWSTSDHLPVNVAGITNPDAKYTDDGIREFLRKIATEPHVIIRIELGQNINATSTILDEWDGNTNRRYKENIRDIVLRWTRIFQEPEFAGRTLAFKLLPPWYTATDQNRMRAQRDALSQLSDEMHTEAVPVALFDQVAELETLYATSGGTQGLDNSVGLMPANGGDPVHQNFDRVNLLATVEWNAEAATVDAGALAFGLGAVADMPPSRWETAAPHDSQELPFVTTHVRADTGGTLSVVWQDGTVETIPSFPAAQATPMRVRAIRATGTTASGIQIGT